MSITQRIRCNRGYQKAGMFLFNTGICMTGMNYIANLLKQQIEVKKIL